MFGLSIAAVTVARTFMPAGRYRQMKKQLTSAAPESESEGIAFVGIVGQDLL
jgi:hypothetical protein